MHPHGTKLLEHAAWLRAKGDEHLESDVHKLCEALAGGMELMSAESFHTVDNQLDEITLQQGLVLLMQLLNERGERVDRRHVAQMMEDVMLPLPMPLFY